MGYSIELGESAKGLLHQTRMVVEKQNEFKQKTGEAFNVFSILNMERLEVRTHSAFIYELLNPKGCHFQGNLFLKAFIEEILEIEDFNFRNVVVDRERSIGDLGRIDLVIENNDTLIIIEMKIDYMDRDKQMIRYDDYAKKRGKSYYIYYLTLFGDEASEVSCGEGEVKVEYTCLSFKEHIYNWIDLCIRKGQVPLLPLIRENLCQYNKLIEKITNKIDRGVTMELKDILLRDNNLEVLEKLNEAIPYAKAELEYRFWSNFYERFNDKIEKMGLSLLDDGEFPYDKESTIETIIDLRKRKYSGYYIEYLVGEYKNNRVRMCIGNSGYDDTLYISIGLQDNEYNTISYKKYDKKILKIFNSLGFDKSGDANKYRYLNYNLNFYSKIHKLTDENIMNEALNSIGGEVLEIVKSINESKELKEILE